MTLSASLLIGALLGAVNAAAAVWTVSRATALAPNRALSLVLGGMLGRLAVLLAAVALVLMLVPVHRGGFVGGLGVVFLVGMVAEVLFVLGRTPDSSSPPADA
ncbi:MAG: ATP synthase subunit I [Bacteroidota bacterium]